MVYLQDIKLENFKCFEETRTLNFGKITLLTGANSTGKSSMMYSVLGALQGKDFPLSYSPNGCYVQMGNLIEMLYKHDSHRTLGINFTLVDSETEEKLKVYTHWICTDAGNPILSSCELIGDFFRLYLRADGDGEQLLDIDVEPGKNKRKLKMEKMLEYANSQTPLDGELLDLLKYSSKETHLKDCLVKEDKTDVMYPFYFSLYEARTLLKRYDASINYICSFRQPAQRIYTEEPVTSGKIATSGEGFINELLRWKDEKQEKFAEFVEAMKSLGLLYEVEPKRLGAGQFKIGVKVHENDEVANLWDVGFGISQTMPVIIADVELGKESTLYVSQPEVHLHPRAQANLGDYLIKQTKNGKRYVIETHSEYLMNRLRLSVVRGDIDEEDIKVYYMGQEDGKTYIYEVKFTKSGQIIGAPKDFFDTYMIDVMDIAMQAK